MSKDEWELIDLLFRALDMMADHVLREEHISKRLRKEAEDAKRMVSHVSALAKLSQDIEAGSLTEEQFAEFTRACPRPGAGPVEEDLHGKLHEDDDPPDRQSTMR